jgi:hypothetical protein
MDSSTNNWLGSNGLTTFSVNCEFLHGGFWEKSTRTSGTQTCMLIQICRWHFRQQAPWPRKTDRISEPPQWTPQQDTVHNGKRRRPPSILGHWHLQKNGWLPRSQSLPEAHPYQSLPTPEFTSPSCKKKNNQSSLPWYTESKLSVTRIYSPKNWNFSSSFSRIMDTALNTYDKPRNRQHRPPRPTINPPRLHTYHTPKQHMANSADCWQNTSKVSHYHQGKSSATFYRSRMPWD